MILILKLQNTKIKTPSYEKIVATQIENVITFVKLVKLGQPSMIKD
jgi:hypothetical protein